MTVFRAFSDEQILDFLRAQVRDGQVFTDTKTLEAQSFSPHLSDDSSGLALAYIEAGSTADIQGVMKAARKFHISVIPQD